MIRGYRAAQSEAVLFDRTSRALLRVSGPAPAEMVSGLITGTMPPDLKDQEGHCLRGRMPYSAMLTPKGRLVTDLRVARLENGGDGSLLFDLPDVGVAAALAHFSKYLPPRLARVGELAEPAAMLTLAGPLAAEILSGSLFDLPVDVEDLIAMEEGDERILPNGSEVGIRVVHTRDISPLAFDVFGSESAVDVLRSVAVGAGLAIGTDGLWEVLRLEQGRPSFGIEMDEDTMPAEAGIYDRCIDESKGCYTGQEVVVRIRDRGHANRHLRGILLGDVPPPDPGTPLFRSGHPRPAGTIRSSVQSERFKQGIALGYLRRELEPPDTVTVGTPDGRRVQVRALRDDGWLLVEGDPSFYP